MTHTIAHPEGVPADLDLDALLGDLSFDGASDEIIGELPLEPEAEEVIEAAPEETVEEVVIEAAPEVVAEAAPVAEEISLDDLDLALAEPAGDMTDDEARHLDLAIGKSEAYEAQEVEATVSDPDEIEASPEAEPAAAAPAKVKKAKGTGTPRVKGDISTLDPEMFVLSTTTVPADLEANKAHVISLRPKQVKVAEKFDNLIAAVSAGRKPSTYVMDCFEVLKARSEVSTGDLVAALQAHGYTIGTARSQAGQIMQLFGTLGIADRAGQKLTLRTESSFAKKLEAIAAA